MDLAIAAGLAGLAAWGLWQLLRPRPRPRFGREGAESGRAPVRQEAEPRTADTAWARRWWILDLPGSPAWLWPLRAAAAALVGAAALAVTRIPLAALLLTAAGAALPGLMLDAWARSRWRAADQAAYTMANTLAFLLPVYGHPVPALRRLAPEVDPPLRAWLREALGQEALGQRTADTALRDLAGRLNHAELGLLADILRTDRLEQPAAHLLRQLTVSWGQRLQDDALRAGKLHAGYLLGLLFTGVPVAGWLLGFLAFPQTMAAFQGSLVGQVAGVAGLAAFLSGGWLTVSVLRQADPGQFGEART